MKDTVIKYAPTAILVVGLIIQWNLFVTPQQIEIKHREILRDVAQIYVPKEQYNMQYAELKTQITNMQTKIDKIYEIITRK